MRGGLDDALDRLARRDELRRRVAGEATGTTPAVTELVEAIAAVVARHPQLGVSVGADGAGEPVLLHFHFADGQVQVTADKPPVAPVEAAPVARHVDIDIDLDEPVEEPYQAPPPPPTDPRRLQDDQDRYGPSTYGYAEPAPTRNGVYYTGSDTAERRYGSFDAPPDQDTHDLAESRDLGARLRDSGLTSRGSASPSYPPHPYAATPPPPVPEAAAHATRPIRPEQHRAPAGQPAHRPPEPRGMPAPLPKPIPLQVERPEETELAARRLAALLRDDPSLLNQSPPD